MESRIQPGPAAGQAALPGRDEITLSPACRPQLCCSREHGQAGVLAGVVVSFGRLADAGCCWHSRDALWPECWGRSFPMCGECWQLALAVVTARRPGLTVRSVAGALPAAR